MGASTIAIQGADTTNNSAGAAASLIVLAAPGILYSLTGYNNKASDQYIQLHDSAALPADASVPKITLVAYAGTPFSYDFPAGRIFTAGIVVCNSSTAITKTIGSADCLFDATFTRKFTA